MTANTPKTRKAKGRKFQQWVAEQISQLLNIPAGKDKDIESREMGQSGPDIKLYGKAKELFPHSCETKAQENFSIHQWVKQARENEEEGATWLLFCKRNREEPIVVLSANLFFELYKYVVKDKIKTS